MDKNDWNDAIEEWLEQHGDDDVGVPPGRHVIPGDLDEVLDEEDPEVIEREHAREFSFRWGWIWDLASALYWGFRSWFTTEIVIGLFRASGALIIAALLFAIIYNVYIARTVMPRRLPTIEELMQPPSTSAEEEEGSPDPMEGSR